MSPGVLALILLVAIPTAALPAPEVSVLVRGAPLALAVLQGDLTIPGTGDIGLELMHDAKTLVPLASEIPSHLDDGAPVNAALQSWKQRTGRKAYGVLRALRWTDDLNPTGETILNRHPEWIAVARDGLRAGQGGRGVYLSPYHPEVRRLLAELAGQVGVVIPALDGIALDCSLSERETLDFSEAARAAHIHAWHVDPLDIHWRSSDPVDRKMVDDWAACQRVAVGSLLRDMIQAYRKRRADGLVVGLADGSFYFRDAVERGAVAGDWLSWAMAGLVDELWLFHAGAPASGKGRTAILADAVTLTRKAGKWPVRLVLDVASVQSPAQLAGLVSEAARVPDATVMVVAGKPEHIQWIAQLAAPTPPGR